MKVLLDEDVPAKLVRYLRHHEVHTVAGRQWGGIKNGELLDLIAGEGFDAFLTGDKNIRTQQNLSGRPFAVLIMSAINWPVVRPHIGNVTAAVDAAVTGSCVTIECGVFVPSSRRPRT